MHLAPLVQDLAVILAVAAIVTLIFHRIRQPVVLGYIIAGIIVGPHTPPFPFITDSPSIQGWAELGVIFLMFSLGLEFSFRKLARVGISAGGTAGVELLGMISLGYACGKFFGWSTVDSIFLGAMLSISSTTIIIKALEELNLKTRRFAQMIFGILIVEDLAAILILVALSTMALSQDFSGLTLVLAAAKLAFVIGCWFIIGYFVVPRFVRYVGSLGSNEMLTILSVGLCLSLVVFAAQFGYSAALGAFIMGSILAESSESKRIEELMLPLRDLFAAIFFVSVGMLINPKMLIDNWGPVLIISLVTILGKIVTTSIGALLTGQTLRTSVQVGFGLAQIGEFSFIIAGLGLTLGVMSEFLYAVAVAVSLVTTFTTPYLIRISHEVAVALESRLPSRFKLGLSRYAAWTQERRADTSRRTAFYQLLFRWILNGTVVTLIFILVSELILPYLRGVITRVGWAGAAGWTIAVALSAPFVWAMLSLFQRYRVGDKPQLLPLFIARLLTVLWISAVSLEFFAARHVLLIAGSLATALFIFFYRHLEISYHWFERHFLSTFEQPAKPSGTPSFLKNLAPWDAHLIRIKVHSNAELTGKSLMETGLRKRYGLNVVAIQRGLKTIVAPHPQETIFPQDELLVLATDEQIEAARSAIEQPPGLDAGHQGIAGYELKNLLLTPESPISQETIRSAGLREKYGAMVVGIERENRRILNPDSDLRLLAGDILWLVGDPEKISALEALAVVPPSIQSSE